MKKIHWFGKRHILVELAVIYIAILGGLYMNQRNLVYVPDRTVATPAQNGVGDMSVIHATTSDGLRLEGWYKPPADKFHPVIIHFHGNAGSLRYRGHEARPFLDQGYGFLLAEYRGYGGNPGKPTEQGLYKDARAFTDWVIAHGVPQDKIVFYGQSLGTGVATEMAVEYPHAAALILSSPYTSLPDVAARTYFFVPVHLLMLDRFDSLVRIAKVKMPVLILHGRKDTVIPFDIGKALYDAANPPKEFAVYPGGTHFNINASGGQTRMLSFLEKHVKP
jgi:fermentation-respiration switch protein FrsA (DUF1100 family)